MSVNGKFGKTARAVCLAVADRFGIGPASRLIRQVAQAVAQWPRFAAAAGVNANEIERIAAQLNPQLFIR